MGSFFLPQHEALDSKSDVFDEMLSQDAASWFQKAIKQAPSLGSALQNSSGNPDDPVSRALLAFGGEADERPGSVRSVLDSMEPTDDGYAFVGILREVSERVTQPHPLADNVVRQFSFVEKMQSHMWLRSPAVEGTLGRAVDRYEKFRRLFRDYPHRILVPTLDIDLVWHTHQLSHSLYCEGMQAVTGRFIDHSDKIGKDTLGVQESYTRGIFEDVFDEGYARCMCWECEAIFSAIEGDCEGEVGGETVVSVVIAGRYSQ